MKRCLFLLLVLSFFPTGCAKNPQSSDILQAIGNTPMLKVDGIYAKAEFLNPSGSIKDRMVAYLIKKAEERGQLKPGQEIIELTSGNTGVALAMISAFSSPVARRRHRRDSKMVPTPIVIARRGTWSKSPPNIGAFCSIVDHIRVLSRVRDRSAERGSLKPM